MKCALFGKSGWRISRRRKSESTFLQWLSPSATTSTWSNAESNPFTTLSQPAVSAGNGTSGLMSAGDVCAKGVAGGRPKTPYTIKTIRLALTIPRIISSNFLHHFRYLWHRFSGASGLLGRTTGSLGDGLWLSPGVAQKCDRHLLVCFSRDIHSSVYSIGWFIPFCLTGINVNSFGSFPIAIFNRQGLSSNDHGHTMIGIKMPRCCLSRLEHQAFHDSLPTLNQCLFDHIQPPR